MAGRRLLRNRRSRPAPVDTRRDRPREPIPGATVLVRPEVVRSIVRAATMEDLRETGGPLIGTVQRSWDGTEGRLIVSVLATVPPGPALNGRVSSVAMGKGADGERAASALRWWRDTTGLDLVHLGDWHRHLPGSPEPSAGDHQTARRMREASPAGVWLTAVAVSEPERTESLEVKGNLGRSTESWSAAGEVRFYRQVLGGRLVAMRIRLEAAAIPRMPALPWHVADPVRFAAECRLLRAAGYVAQVHAATPDGRPGVTFRLSRDGDEPLTIVTASRYPREAPASLTDRGLAPIPGWSPARFLADVVGSDR